MSVKLTASNKKAAPLRVVDRASLKDQLAALPAAARAWVELAGFDASAHSHVLLPDAAGGLAEVWVGADAGDDPWLLASLPAKLPPGNYRLSSEGIAVDPQAAALSWSLGAHRFDRYRKAGTAGARQLLLAPGEAARKGLQLATAIAATRDLVNTPAEHMGPADLQAAAVRLGKLHGAKVRCTVGDALLKAGFPAIHAVGRAAPADRAPRLIELTWGKPKAPRLAIVGKGVCFDTGGLDLKPSSGMRLMKKDMGGAAHALGLASLVMEWKLPVRLQLLIPAVDNAVSGNAYRPGDVLSTRKGLSVEIGNTDAEGRVVLSDALALAAEGKPDLIVDLATLTGAARVALGAELPALFCRDMAVARELVDRGLTLGDPLWHLPLWDPYHASIESDIADINNSGKDGLAGAITAALFLQDFVPRDVDWLHLDVFAWNNRARAGRPVGGEGQALRTLIDFLARRYGA